jgi:hypothetical protein
VEKTIFDALGKKKGEFFQQELTKESKKYLDWVAKLPETEILGYFMNTEALGQGIARTEQMIFLEHLWVVSRLLENLSISQSGELLCKHCFTEKYRKPDLSAGHGIPKGKLAGTKKFFCEQCNGLLA